MSNAAAGSNAPPPGPLPRAVGGARARRALGLIELLAVVAVLVIGLGMVVATARHVRSASANELTRKRVQALVDAANGLIARGVDPTLSLSATTDLTARMHTRTAAGASTRAERDVRPAAPMASDDETIWHAYAALSSRRLADRLGDASTTSAPGSVAGALAAAAAAAGAGANVVAGVVGGPPELNDAWDHPIALIARPTPAIGMAPDDGPFFVSAGPDGRFLTLADNLYSYDIPALLSPVPIRPGPPTTGPAR